MFFSRVTIKPDALGEGRAWSLFRDIYRIHQSIWRMCNKPDDKERTFLYREDRLGRKPVLYIVSSQQPTDPDGVWSIETKPYKPVIQSGEQLGFMLKANPVVKKKDQQGKSHRHDVVMNAKTSMRAEQPRVAWKNQAKIVQDVGMKWLMDRAERFGFGLDEHSARVLGYRQHAVLKKGAKPLRFSTLEYEGALHVTDPERFNRLLIKGIGQSKGFGCGLMMVRRL